MSHATEGSIQEYLDGEIEGAEAIALAEHLDACEVCSRELASLRDASMRTHEALLLLDAPVPMLRARAAIAAGRGTPRRGLSLTRLGTGALARAAMLLLVLAGAGAAAIPDVRRAIETTFARVAELFGAGAAVPAPEPVIAPPPTAVEAEATRGVTFIPPVDGRVRVVLHAPEGPLDVVVRLIDGPRAQVETLTEDGQFRRRSGPGRLELMGLTAGSVTIGIPRDLTSATVEVDGRVLVYKQGQLLRSAGPEGTVRGSEMRFRTGY